VLEWWQFGDTVVRVKITHRDCHVSDSTLHQLQTILALILTDKPFLRNLLNLEIYFQLITWETKVKLNLGKNALFFNRVAPSNEIEAWVQVTRLAI